MGILASTEIETGELIDLDADLVMITSVTHTGRSTFIVFEMRQGAGNPVRHEHHIRESFNLVVDALGKASQPAE